MIHIVAPAPHLWPSYYEANAQPMVSYRNLLAEGALTSASSPTVNPRANAVTEDTASFWGATGADTLRTTLASAAPADVCMIAAHSLGTDGRTLSLQYHNGSAWVTIVTYDPPDDQPFMIVFPRVTATQWGIALSGASTIGVAWIGPRLIIPGGVVPGYSEVWASRSIRKLGGNTNRGHWLGQRVDSVTAQLSATFMPMPYEFARVNMADFRARYNEGRAFVWASAPGIFPEDAAYCWAVGDDGLRPVPHAGGDLCDLTLDMVAYCEP